MTIPENPESFNFDFLSKLKPGERVGLDKKTGKLYRPYFFSWESGVATPIIQDLASESVTAKLNDPKFHQKTQGRTEYLKVIDEFGKKNLLTPMQRQTIAYSYYNQRRNDLEETKEFTKEEIEAMIAVEMSFDPNILEADRKKMAPEYVEGGGSGVYFLKDLEGNRIGVFKPMFQEARMPDNPKDDIEMRDQYDKNKPTRTQRKGHEQGTGWICEVAAYEIDKDHFVGIPFTSKMTLPFPKIWKEGVPNKSSIELQTGSFQFFVKHDASLNEIAIKISAENPKEVTQKVKELIPIDQLERIIAFDIATGNSDRHYGNVLVDKEQQKLIPIDHGLILLDNLDWEKPLGYSEGLCYILELLDEEQPISQETADWILSYDLEKKSEALRKIGVSESALRDHFVRITFMKEGVRQGFTLPALGKLSTVTKKGRMSWTTWLDDLVLDVKKGLPKDATQEDFESKFKELLKEGLSKLKTPKLNSKEASKT